MPEEITFEDLISLTKINADTTSEKFSGLINSGFWDGANILGTLSTKKLIQFPSGSLGQQPVALTESGKQLISEADSKSGADLDNLDLTTLIRVKNGATKAGDIAKALNLRSRDMAMHLYKLMKQGYIIYDFRSGALSIMLTEQGFSLATAGVLPSKNAPEGEAMAAQPAPQQMPQQQAAQAPKTPQTQTPAPQAKPNDQTEKPKGMSNMALIAIIVVIIIVLLVYYAFTTGKI